MSRFDCRCKSAWAKKTVSTDSTDHTFLPIRLSLRLSYIHRVISEMFVIKSDSFNLS